AQDVVATDRPIVLRCKRIRLPTTAETERHHGASAREPNRPQAEGAPAPRYPARSAPERRRLWAPHRGSPSASALHESQESAWRATGRRVANQLVNSGNLDVSGRLTDRA